MTARSRLRLASENGGLQADGTVAVPRDGERAVVCAGAGQLTRLMVPRRLNTRPAAEAAISFENSLHCSIGACDARLTQY